MMPVIPVTRSELERALLATHLLTQNVKLAIQVVEESQGAQLTKDGTPFLENHTYPVVIEVINNFGEGLNDLTVAAALLHDVLEDTAVTENQLNKIFPKQIVYTVRLLTRQKESKGASDETKLTLSASYMQQIHGADYSTRLIKLSDRMVNLWLVARLKNKHPETLRRYIIETNELFIPLAKLTSPTYAERIAIRIKSLRLLLN
ncbi:MAG TPA: HD domain-containing protein [Acinetobacter johnsonii]|nr:HD domain-containing protein [Acinetobacter johnsonii]